MAATAFHRSEDTTIATLDIAGDVRRVFETVQAGGIAAFPDDVGYAVLGGFKQALQKIFDTKQRGGNKHHSTPCSAETQREMPRRSTISCGR